MKHNYIKNDQVYYKKEKIKAAFIGDMTDDKILISFFPKGKDKRINKIVELSDVAPWKPNALTKTEYTTELLSLLQAGGKGVTETCVLSGRNELIEAHINVEKEFEDSTIPKYQSEGAAGFDLHAYLEDHKSIVLNPGERGLISSGLRFSIPEGLEMQIRPRSGLAYKHGITVLNSPATIDSDYRGVVKILIINHGHEPFTINHGDRIAQGVIAPVGKGKFNVVAKLDETERGSGGFGHTGK